MGIFSGKGFVGSCLEGGVLVTSLFRQWGV